MSEITYPGRCTYKAEMDNPDNTRKENPDATSSSVANSDLQQWLKPDAPPDVVERFVAFQRMVHYSGPLPPADELSRYDEACPGAADRIIGMAEKALDLQGASMEGNIGLAKRRINASVMVSGGMLLVAGLCVIYEPAWLALPLSGTGILTLLARELFRKVRSK